MCPFIQLFRFHGAFARGNGKVFPIIVRRLLVRFGKYQQQFIFVVHIHVLNLFPVEDEDDEDDGIIEDEEASLLTALVEAGLMDADLVDKNPTERRRIYRHGKRYETVLQKFAAEVLPEIDTDHIKPCLTDWDCKNWQRKNPS